MTVVGQTITDERLAEIIKGCEGVSPGPWSSSIMEIGSDEAIVRSAGLVVATTRIGEKPGRYALNADHIARLDPQTVRSLLTELQHRREAEAGSDVLRPDIWNAAHELAATEYPRIMGGICQQPGLAGALATFALRFTASPSSPASGVRVKALEWRKVRADWYADCIVGQYAVGYVGSKVSVVLRHVVDGQDLDTHISKHSTHIEGRAAAQADYEARILSALGEHP